MSDEETRAQEILAPFKKRINQTPALLSLLYDANMLPEQIVTVRGAISVAAVVTAYDAGATARIEALEMKLATALALIEELEGEQARADALEAQLAQANAALKAADALALHVGYEGVMSGWKDRTKTAYDTYVDARGFRED